ncbi:hypothetical protein TWF694_009616 [Orbilia ellipsospora]|uniref:Uncharacterized protein n=1 Tax=Orbilia ellipsospora TaxID=2528407 RepID=A0AAV9XCQ9_9PEZI
MPPFHNSRNFNDTISGTSMRSKRELQDQEKKTPMENLRIKAAKCLKTRLKLRIKPHEVKFNGKPLEGKDPKGLDRKTIYIWRIKGNLNDEESFTVKHITNSGSDNRKRCKWSDQECGTLASMITQGRLFPEFYDEDCISLQRIPSCLGVRHDGTSEQLSLDTTTANQTEADIWSLQESDDDTHTNKRGMKRLRSPSLELGGFGYDLDELFSTEPSYIASEIDDSETTIASSEYSSRSQPPTTIEERRSEGNTQVIKRCRVQTIESSENFECNVFTLTGREDTRAALSPQAGHLPRLMVSNAAGILDLSPSVLEATPLPQPAENAIAPVAASPIEIQSKNADEQPQLSSLSQPARADGTHLDLASKAPDTTADSPMIECQDPGDPTHPKPDFKEVFFTAIHNYYGLQINLLKEENHSLKCQNDYLSSCLGERDRKIQNLEIDSDTANSRITEFEARAQASEAKVQRLTQDIEGFVKNESTVREKFDDLTAQLEDMRKTLKESQEKETLLQGISRRQADSFEMERDAFHHVCDSFKEQADLFFSRIARPKSQQVENAGQGQDK